MAFIWARLTCRQLRSFSSSAAGVNEFKFIKVSDEGNVRRIRLDSPKTRNAMSLELMKELSTAFAGTLEHKKLHCVVLSAEGSVFSAGHNLKELTKEKGIEHHKMVFDTCTALMDLIIKCPVPIVSSVDGIAAAAGCQLVAMTDIVVASSRSSFSTPGVSLGLFCSTPGVAVVRSVPSKVAAYMLYTGLPITASEALAAGLVSRVVPPEDIQNETEKVVQSICEKSRPVVRLGKQFLQHQVKLDILNAYRDGAQIMVNNLQLEDAKEGINSFVQKRKPHFNKD